MGMAKRFFPPAASVPASSDEPPETLEDLIDDSDDEENEKPVKTGKSKRKYKTQKYLKTYSPENNDKVTLYVSSPNRQA